MNSRFPHSPRLTAARLLRVALVCTGLLVVAIGLALSTGAEPVRLRTALSAPDSVDAAILFTTRLPRVLLGALVGAALAPAGVAFQALLRNPLADPYVLGVSGGASVAATLAIVLVGEVFFLGSLTLPVFAFLGAAVSILMVLALGRVRGRLVPSVVILAGVVLNALASAIILAVRIVASPSAAHHALYWLTGSLASVESVEGGVRLSALAAYVTLGLFILFRQATAMNAFAMGDDTAHVVGVATDRARLQIFLAASLLTGAAVAVSGPIGFVGIVVPHTLRLLLGPDHRLLIIASSLLGGAFLVSADAITRVSLRFIGEEPPVGVFTVLLGVPFFLVLLRRRLERSLF